MEVRKPLAEDRSRMAQRGVAAYKALQGLEMVQPDSIAAAGFCFGGMAVLDLARSGLAPDLRATITYHGILDSPDLGSRSDGQVNGKLLVFHGDKDPFIPPDKFREFEEDLKRREADYKIVRFANGMHAFTRYGIWCRSSSLNQFVKLFTVYFKQPDSRPCQARKGTGGRP